MVGHAAGCLHGASGGTTENSSRRFTAGAFESFQVRQAPARAAEAQLDGFGEIVSLGGPSPDAVHRHTVACGDFFDGKIEIGSMMLH